MPAMRPLLCALVLAAVAVFAGTEAAAATQSPVPAAVTRQIKAAYGPATLLPRSLPSGYIFTGWEVEDATTNRHFQRTLTVRFGKNGSLLQWSILDAREQRGHFPCSAKPVPGVETRVIMGRLVHHASGNEGEDAWSCLKIGATRVVLWLWNPHTLAPTRAMTIVAAARRV